MVKVFAYGLAAVAAIAAFRFGWLPGEMRDFEVYWTAASRALEAQPLYRSADGHYQFKYLPAFAVLTSPIGLLPLAKAKAAWFVLSVVLLVALISLSVSLLPHRRRQPWLIVLIVLIAMGKFYGHELVLGQVNILFAVLTTAGILMTRTGDGAPEIPFMGAAAVKPYGIIFFPWVAYVRGRRAILATAAGLVLLLAVPAVLYGPRGSIELHRQWWRTVTESTTPNLTNNDNVSVAGMYAKWLGPGASATRAAVATTFVLIAAIAFVIARRRTVHVPEPLEGALLLTCIPLVSPQGWDYVFLITTPAIALFANYDDFLPGWLRWTTWTAVATIGLSLFDVMGRERYAAFMSLSVITICYLVLVAALIMLRARRIT
jgi:hypothetical protein